MNNKNDIYKGFEKKVNFLTVPINIEDGFKDGGFMMKIFFYLIGKDKAISFSIMNTDNKWLPCEMGRHLSEPLFEEVLPHDKKCKLLGSKQCYYDDLSPFLNLTMMEFLTKGEDGLWKQLYNNLHIEIKFEIVGKPIK